MKKKLLGLILAVAMGLSVFPSATAYATEPAIQLTEDYSKESDEETVDEAGEADSKESADELNEADETAKDETAKDETVKDETVKDETVSDTAAVEGDSVEVETGETTEVSTETEGVDETEASTEEADAEVAADKAQEEEGFVVSFDSFEGGKIVAYDRKEIEGAVVIDDATTIVARDSDTGEVDTTGNGQANFSVVLEDGYALVSLAITEGEGNYKNLKTISEEGNVYTYRITKITGNLRITVETKLLSSDDNRALLIEELNETINSYPVYYMTYCTQETAAALTEALAAAKALDIETATSEEIEKAVSDVNDAVAALVYKTAEVPQIFISTKDGVGNKIKKDDGYVETSIVIADGNDTLIDNGGSIKVRGNSTAMAAKKPFNIKLSSKQDLFGMGSSKKWCLLANCFDVTLMRNRTGLELAKVMGVPYTSENMYVDLWVDGVYKGSYLMTEAVEVASTRVDINLKQGDFILEVEKTRVEEETTYIKNKNGLRFSFKEPEEPTEAQFNHVQETLDMITAVIDSGDYSEVEKVIDIESFAKYYVVNEYMRNNDFNYSSAYFFYKDGKFYAGPAWDFDLSSGNGSDDYASYKIPNAPWASKANWYPYLLKYSEFQKAVMNVFDEFDDYMANIAADGGFIDTTLDTYRASFDRNFNEAGWEVTKKYSANQTAPLPTYEENVEFYKNFLKARYNWMNTYYRNLIPNVFVNSVEAADDGIKVTWREEEGVDTYRVYRREDDSWKAISGLVKGNTYTDLTAEVGVDYYYDVVAVINGSRGTLDYDGKPGKITEKVIAELKIVKQPESVMVKNVNDTAVFTVEASGKAVQYMWYVKTPDSDRFIKTGAATPEYTRKMYAKNDGIQVYCVVTDGYGNKLTSNIATATFGQTLEIVKDTADVVVNKAGDKVSFTIEAKGSNVEYCWYYKMPEQAGGDGKFHKAGCYANEYTRTGSAKNEGMQVYCVVTDAAGNKCVGRTATFTIAKADALVITYPNGKEINVASGKLAIFKVETNAEGVSYSWYYKLPEQAGGDGKFHKAGNYTNEYSRTASANKNGMQAYCVITDATGKNINSDVMTLVLK